VDILSPDILNLSSPYSSYYPDRTIRNNYFYYRIHEIVSQITVLQVRVATDDINQRARNEDFVRAVQGQACMKTCWKLRYDGVAK
jgi:hypothetical protein